MAMQMLWCKVFKGNCPIIVDQFLYCSKPSKIKQFAGFQGPQFSLIRGHSSFDRLWKKKFFFVSRNWAGHPSDVNKALFPPFTSALGRLRPEGTSFTLYFVYFYLLFSSSNHLFYLCSHYLVHAWTSFIWSVLIKLVLTLRGPSIAW